MSKRNERKARRLKARRHEPKRGTEAWVRWAVKEGVLPHVIVDGEVCITKAALDSYLGHMRPEANEEADV